MILAWLRAPENRGRIVLIIGICLIWLFLLLGFHSLGYTETWELWNIPTLEPRFIDFRLIPGSAESFRQGFEPTINNPQDPQQRIFNYPAFWRVFFYTNISMDDTTWVVSSMLIVFFIAVVAFSQKPSIPDALFIALIAFSPAAMLLYERGNVDLLIFSLCVAIIFTSEYSAISTAILIGLGGILKMYPVFGLVVLWRNPRLKFIGVSIGVILFMTIYAFLTFPSQITAWETTMRGDNMSYGTFVFVTRLGHELPALFTINQWKFVFEAFALLLIAVATCFAMRAQAPVIAQHERNLAAFRMGASIYLGTFLLGNNWDYRLIFLVLTIPQLMEWFRTADGTRKWFTLVIVVSIFLSCWHFIVAFDFPIIPLPDYDSRNFVLDELTNWLLVPGLTYFLILSSPDWLREMKANFS